MFEAPRDPDLTYPRPNSTRGVVRWSLAGNGWRFVAAGVLGETLWHASAIAIPVALGAVTAALTETNFVLARWLGLSMFAAGVCAGAGMWFSYTYTVRAYMHGALRFRQGIGHHVTHVGRRLTQQCSAGEASTVIGTDTENLGRAAGTAVTAIAALVGVVIVSVMTCAMSWRLAAILLIGTPLSLLLQAFLIQPVHTAQANQRCKIGRASEKAQDGLAGLRVLRSIGAEGPFLESYVKQSQVARNAGIRVAVITAIPRNLTQLAPLLLLVAVLVVGLREVQEGRIGPATLVTFVALTGYLAEPMDMLSQSVSTYVETHASAQRTLSFLSIPSRREAEPAPTLSTPIPQGVLRDTVTGVSFLPSEFTVVVCEHPRVAREFGARLTRMSDNESDIATLDGRSLISWPIEDVRTAVTFCDSTPQLLSGSLRSVLDPAGIHQEKDCLAALAAAHASDVLNSLPGGVLGQVAERGSSLSGGQRQRISLSRALLADPNVLVLVEPTSAVDAPTEAVIAQRVRRFRAGRATIVFSSSPLMVSAADKVVLVTAEQIVVGAPSELAGHQILHRLMTRGRLG